jgi:translation initiation factor IF-3
LCTEACIDKRFIRINERIRAREIRVIDDEGKQIGILPPYEALKMARERNLDLVEISPTANPPVCRIMDYGKYLYQQEKREREAKKHQHQITVKEVKFRINVDEHDYQTKKNHVLRFLEEGDKVKATIFFRGREMTRTSLGRQVLERLLQDVADKSIVEFRPRQEGNTLHAILAPKKA